MNLLRIIKIMIVLVMLATAAHAQSASASATTTAPTKAEKIKAAKDEIVRRYAGRKADAARLVSDLKACTAGMPEGQARREAEKAITNLESAIGKADGEAAKGVLRKAFVALGRPAKAAQAALRRCQSGAKAPAEKP